jgi:hypothetical protein
MNFLRLSGLEVEVIQKLFILKIKREDYVVYQRLTIYLFNKKVFSYLKINLPRLVK